jgi:hypothetical protein
MMVVMDTLFCWDRVICSLSVFHPPLKVPATLFRRRDCATFARRGHSVYPRAGDAKRSLFRMVGWSVAVGRFFEALFWAMMQAAGQIALGTVAGLVTLVVVWRLVRRRWPWARWR